MRSPLGMRGVICNERRCLQATEVRKWVAFNDLEASSFQRWRAFNYGVLSTMACSFVSFASEPRLESERLTDNEFVQILVKVFRKREYKVERLPNAKTQLSVEELVAPDNNDSTNTRHALRNDRVRWRR